MRQYRPGESTGSSSNDASSSGSVGKSTLVQGVQQTGGAAKPGAGAATGGTATTKTNVNVRKSASMQGAIIETTKPGQTFKVLANVGSWYQIEHASGTAYITTLHEYVDFKPAPKPEQPATTTAAPDSGDKGGGGGGSWLDDAWNAAVHLVDNVMHWFEGSPEEQKQAEGTPPGAKGPTGKQEVVEDKGGAGSTPDTKPTSTPAVPGGHLLFKDAFEVVDAKAQLRDAALKSTGKTIAQGTKVFVVKAERTYVQIITDPTASEQIAEGDNVWTAFSNLGGTGAAVGLGNEKSDDADKQKAEDLRAGLPSGRNPGHSKFKWQFSNYFQPSLEGKALQGSLMAKVQRLMQWAVENDMVTGDIIIGDGVRGPKTAHKMCVSWNIQYRWGSVITLDALKKLPNGKDSDGTQWYQEGWDEEQIKAHAKEIRSSNKIAAAGYEPGDAARAPLPLSGKPGVSRHCTGRAVDVTIPWRTPGKDAATNATDVWAWEDVYKQFGLHRPLHRDLGFDANLQENWHIEETDKKLDGDNETG